MRSPEGQLFEVQFHTPASFELKMEDFMNYTKNIVLSKIGKGVRSCEKK